MRDRSPSALTKAETSYPSLSGMLVSARTMSGGSAAIRSIASRPSPTVTTRTSSSAKVISMTR